MWLIAPSGEECRRAVDALRSAVEEIHPGSAVFLELPTGHLGYFQAKASDNLHIYRDGIVIGKISFGEDSAPGAILHSSTLPQCFHPLLEMTVIRFRDDTVLIQPNGTTPVFYFGGYVSDSQLLIAKAAGLRPSAKAFAVLATVGYFPGTMSLFREVRKLDFGEAYDMRRQKAVRLTDFALAEWNDERILDRLISIVPRDCDTYLGISGGCDSRFVLALLLSAGVRPTLLHLDSDESPIVYQIGQHLDLPVIVDQGCVPLGPRLYTLLTDGQIYLYGGNYSRLRHLLQQTAVYHIGLFSDALLKNAFKTVWKTPEVRTARWRLVRYGLLNYVPVRVPGIGVLRSRHEILNYILENYGHWPDFLEKVPLKVAANWLYWHSRGLRWSYATTLDLRYFCYVVFLLSDVDALAHGIGSPRWQNFAKVRVRTLNRRLLPALNVDYSDGLSVDPARGLASVGERIYYEYVKRLFVALKGRHAFRTTRPSIAVTECSDVRVDLNAYLDRSFPQIVESGDVLQSVKRAAVTLAYVLDFLER